MRRDTYAMGEQHRPQHRRRPSRGRTVRSDFRLWLDTSRPGDTYTYHTGLLIADRSRQVYTHGLARDAHDAYRAGAVVLMQRRCSPTACDYLAIRI